MTTLDAHSNPDLRKAAELVCKALMEHMAKVDATDRDERTGGVLTEEELKYEFSVSLASMMSAVRASGQTAFAEFLAKRGKALDPAIAA